MTSKPAGVLEGHSDSVTAVQFITQRNLLFSFAKDKVSIGAVSKTETVSPNLGKTLIKKMCFFPTPVTVQLCNTYDKQNHLGPGSNATGLNSK